MSIEVKLRTLASERLSSSVTRGEAAYERCRMLPRLLPIDPSDLEPSPARLHDPVDARLIEAPASGATPRRPEQAVRVESSSATGSPALTRRICLLLARALRAERRRGRAGHWSYDLNRHLGLLQAYRAERATLDRETSVRGRRIAAERRTEAEGQADETTTGRDSPVSPRRL